MPYNKLSSETWFLIISSIASFALGVFTIHAARSSMGVNNNVFQFRIRKEIDLSYSEKTLKISIIIFGLIGLINAIHTWIVLINMFNGIGGVFLAASSIYSMRVHSKIEGIIPYFQVFSLIGIFLSGIYSAYKNKFSMISLLPLLGYFLKSLALFARIGMLVGIACFITSFLLTKLFLLRYPGKKEKRVFGSSAVIIVAIILVILGAVTVRSTRGTYENFKGTNKTLSSLKSNVFFSPSIYLYLSSHVGVLNKYLLLEKESNRFGETTFAPIYNLLSKYNLTERVKFDKRGYYIPMWTNTGTFLRDLHADFGVWGVFIFIYLLGLFTTYFWFAFFTTGSLKFLVLLSYGFMIIEISFFSLILTGADFVMSLIFLIIYTHLLEKRSLRRVNNG
jgi:oligosaccharide repeat unit polymerase